MTSQEGSGVAREKPRELYVVDMRGRVTSEMCVLFRGHNIILTPFQPTSLQWVGVLL